MKKPFLILGSLILSLAMASCGGGEDGDFPFVLQNDQLNLLNASSRSCRLQSDPANFGSQADDLTAAVLNIGKITITWSGSDNLVIDHMTITMKADGFNNGQAFSTTVSGSDLAYLWWQTPVSGQAPPTAVSFAPSTAITTNPNCAFSIGNIPITDKTKSISGQGSILISGTYGTSPVQSTQYFSFTFVGENPGI